MKRDHFYPFEYSDFDQTFIVILINFRPKDRVNGYRVMVIVEGNGHGDTISNPGRD